MRRAISALGVATAIVALSVATVGPTALAKAGGVVSNAAPAATAAQQAQVRAYWTKARMAAAKPMPMPKVSRQAIAHANSEAVPTGKAGALNGKAPAATKPSIGASSARSVSGAASPTPADYAYPFPFTRFYVDGQLYPGVYPYITVGKLFFNQNGGSYVCSASSVVSAPNQSIWTAGHCTAAGDGSHWSSSVLFVPAYRGGATPYGTFACNGLVTSSAWFYSGDFTLDMGAASCGTNSSGQTLQSRVGSLGFSWNQSRYQHFNAFGYPQASPFNGLWLTTCEASYATYEQRFTGANYPANAIGCDMTGGSSGGPWIIYFKSGNWINGHNDYKWSDQPLAMYSPYFVTLTNHIRCVAAGDTSC
jgi:V8-like Glu-specific endopeptidase